MPNSDKPKTDPRTPLHWDEAPPPPPRPPRAMFEVTAAELDRTVAKVVGRVERGQIAVITRHGLPAAIMLSISDAVELLPAEVMMGPEGAALSRKYLERLERRRASARMHGRWY